MPARVLEGLCPHVDSEEAALDVADLTPESAHDDRLSRRDVPGVLEGQFQFIWLISLTQDPRSNDLRRYTVWGGNMF